MLLRIRQYLDFNKTKYHEKIIDTEEIKNLNESLKIFDVEISHINLKEKETKLEKCSQS